VHVVGPVLGLTRPGMTIVCVDSHNSTHEEQPMSRSIEEPLEAVRGGQSGRERLACFCGHRISSRASWAAARTTSMPGPEPLAGSGRKSRPSNAPATAYDEARVASRS